MQRKPPYSLPTEETEDCSSEQNVRTTFINSLDQASIIDVWSDNFYEEMEKISVLTKKYNILAIDTQFPSIEDYNHRLAYLTESQHEKYLRVTKNVDKTSLIQLGMCLTDEDGNVPGQRFCWQFNFKFEGDIEAISSSSAVLLKKAGINFEKLRQQGISYKTFTNEFIKSGLLLNKRNKWVVFHGGYDFSYMLKLIRNECSPKSTEEFYQSIKIYFPQKIDLKLVIQKEKKFKKLGLSKLADALLCSRIGPEHQAGSDALLTLQCYFQIKHEFKYLLEGTLETDNKIFGIGASQQKFIHPEIHNQSQIYSQMDQANWNAMQPNFLLYRNFSQGTISQENLFVIDQSYQNSMLQWHQNQINEPEKSDIDQQYQNEISQSHQSHINQRYQNSNDKWRQNQNFQSYQNPTKQSYHDDINQSYRNWNGQRSYQRYSKQSGKKQKWQERKN